MSRRSSAVGLAARGNHFVHVGMNLRRTQLPAVFVNARNSTSYIRRFDQPIEHFVQRKSEKHFAQSGKKTRGNLLLGGRRLVWQAANAMKSWRSFSVSGRGLAISWPTRPDGSRPEESELPLSVVSVGRTSYPSHESSPASCRLCVRLQPHLAATGSPHGPASRYAMSKAAYSVGVDSVGPHGQPMHDRLCQLAIWRIGERNRARPSRRSGWGHPASHMANIPPFCARTRGEIADVPIANAEFLSRKARRRTSSQPPMSSARQSAGRELVNRHGTGFDVSRCVICTIVVVIQNLLGNTFGKIEVKHCPVLGTTTERSAGTRRI